MSYPNLKPAMDEKRVRQLDLARVLKISPQGFSLRMHRWTAFAPHEKTRIAEFLGFEAGWLFAEGYIPVSARQSTRNQTEGEIKEAE